MYFCRGGVVVGGRGCWCWRLFGSVGGGGHAWPGSLITADLSWWGGVCRSAAPPPPPRPDAVDAAATTTIASLSSIQALGISVDVTNFSQDIMLRRTTVLFLPLTFHDIVCCSLPYQTQTSGLIPDPAAPGLSQVMGLCTLPSSSSGLGSGRAL